MTDTPAVAALSAFNGESVVWKSFLRIGGVEGEDSVPEGWMGSEV
jgi:hypothetical protein